MSDLEQIKEMEAPLPYNSGVKYVESNNDYDYGYIQDELPPPRFVPSYNQSDHSHGLPQPYTGDYSQSSFASSYDPRYPHGSPHLYPPGAGSQPQHQMVVVVANPSMPPVVMYDPNPVSMARAIRLSVVVYWCFGFLFGGIAYVLASLGENSLQAGDVAGARRYRNASYGMSAAGIAAGVAVTVVSVILTYNKNISNLKN